jgi:SAM-dependent methyltransferase
VIYQHPLAYLLGLEGIALLQAFSGVYDQDFTLARFHEIRTLLDSAEELGDGVEARPITTREGYDRWAPFYDEPGNHLLDIEQPIVREILDSLPVGVALDAACGTGRHTAYLASLGHRVIGVDTSPEMLALAREKVREGEFYEADLHDVPLPDDSVDLVVCAIALSHVLEGIYVRCKQSFAWDQHPGMSRDKAGGLLLEDGFRRLRRGDRVRVAMHELPGAVLGAEDAGDAETNCGEVVATTDLGPEALYFHDAGEIIRDVPCDALEADDLTVSVARSRSRSCLSDVLPTASERAERVAKRCILPMGVQSLKRLGVPFHNFAQRKMACFDRTLKIIRGHQYLLAALLPSQPNIFHAQRPQRGELGSGGTRTRSVLDMCTVVFPRRPQGACHPTGPALRNSQAPRRPRTM